MSTEWIQDGDEAVLVGRDRKFGGRTVELLRAGLKSDGTTGHVQIPADVTFSGDTGGDTPSAADVPVADASAVITATDAEGALTELAKRVLAASANETAIKAIPAAARANGTAVVDLTNDVIWTFDSGSAAGASAWVLVPDVGTGRWLRKAASLADLAAITNGNGASLVGIEDAATIYTAANVEAALAEVKVLADAGMTTQKRTVTIAHDTAAVQAEADNGDPVIINIGATLPANARIVGTDFRSQTSFSGGGASAVTIKVGTVDDDDALVASADVFAAAVDAGPATITQGVRPTKTYAVAGAQLTATITPDVGHSLQGLTAGSVVVDVLFVVLA